MDRQTKERAAALLTKELADKGKLIEGGWAGFRIMTVPDGAPDIQIQEMRNAFMAGATHLYSSMMSVMESGEEPTDADLRRMSLIHNELAAFQEELEFRAAKGGRSRIR